jgi:molybdopterin-guanine dinucleotide biosynthesis protein A
VTDAPVAAAGVVLAGGRARRFGRDKLAAALPDGRPLLRHAVEAVVTACTPVVVVLGPGMSRPEWLPREVRTAYDAEQFGGPLVGLVAGLEALGDATGDHEIVLVVGGDMPSLAPEVLRLLAATLASAPAATSARLEMTERGTASANRPPAILPCAVRRAAALETARAALSHGDRRLRALSEGSSVAFVPAATWRLLDPTAATLADVDRPSDLPGTSDPGGSRDRPVT